ncbi:MAG: hypothetical protein IH591_16955 [Bacteroidales bacterium]|nr:hypothetical protein [Bacteroidales bacterium]
MRSTLNIVSIVLLFIYLHPDRLNGQEVTVKSEIDTTSILTGDQIWFRVILDRPAGLDLKLNRFSDTIVSSIEIIRGPVSDTTDSANDREIITDSYLITSFDSGRYEIPPVFAEHVTEEGLKRYYSDFLYLSVLRPDISPQDSTMRFFDIIGPYRAPLTAGEILPWLLIIMAATIAAWFLFRYIKSRRKIGEEILPEDPQEAAHVLAYRSLEKLKSEKLWQKGLFKDYYSRLSGIVRTYIDMRFGMNSMESATSEIMMEIVEIESASGEASDALKQVLELADMVKFAKYMPDASDCELSMEQAWSFVSLTRKEKITEEIEGEADKEEEI